MLQSWMVTVDGQAYGPYTLDQMRKFIAEGRVVEDSLIAASDEAATHLAIDDPAFAEFFRPAKPQTPAALKPKPAVPGFGRHREPEEEIVGHFVIIADMKLRSVDDLEEAIFGLGDAVQLLPQAWLLTTTRSFNTVRGMLMSKLAKPDMLFIVDATRDKASWFNFGLEADSRIRRTWDRTAPAKSA